METEFWVLLVLGKGQGRHEGQEALSIHPEKFTYIGIRIKRLAKKIVQNLSINLYTSITVRTTSLKSQYPFVGIGF
jgi:hypothetical protein